MSKARQKINSYLAMESLTEATKQSNHEIVKATIIIDVRQ